MAPRILSLFLAWVILCSGMVRGASEWQPAHTWVFYASICSWPAKAGLSSFTGARRDEDFVAQFKAAGVPGKNVVFLKDSAATHGAMRDGLAALAARAGAGPDDTLIFAFQGHGSRKLLYCYDYDAARPDETVFHMDEIFPILDKSWKGQRLILIGDCCCSGSLRSVLAQFARQRPEVRVAALASATASNVSTGNWTFTEGLIRALRGDPIIDRDHDGRLSISEVDRFIHDQMKYKEDQLASLTLYEPVSAWLLPPNDPAREEFEQLGKEVSQCAAVGDTPAGAARFIDYWTGEGSCLEIDVFVPPRESLLKLAAAQEADTGDGGEG